MEEKLYINDLITPPVQYLIQRENLAESFEIKKKKKAIGLSSACLLYYRPYKEKVTEGVK